MAPTHGISGGRISRPDIDLAAAFQQAPIGLAVFDRDLRFIYCNDALAQMNGFPVDDHIGRSAFDLLPELAAAVHDDFTRVFDTGEPLRDRLVRGATPASPEQDRVWLESVIPLPSATGEIDYVLASVKEITDHDRTQRALIDSENRFRIAQQLSPDAYAVLRAIRDSNGQIVDFIYEYANPAAELKSRQPLTGCSVLNAFPANAHYPELFSRYCRLLAEHSADAVELRYDDEHVSGWYRNSAVAIDDDRIAVSFRDITAQKSIEEQLRVLADEYRHRLKNAFNVMRALTRQSAKSATGIQSLSDDVCNRLLAMSAAQDILAQESGGGSLGNLVDEILKPFAGPQLVVKHGPDVQVPHDGVVALALALNEMVTNAIKFGALSTRQGQVTLGWHVEGKTVCLDWEERGGPPVAEPGHEGFGTRLIKDVERRLPSGTVIRDFAPEGLGARISFELI